MAMEVITKPELLEALTKLVERGDGRWANQDEIPTRESISDMVSESIGDDVSVLVEESLKGKGVLQEDDVGGLTDDEIDDILAIIGTG